MRDNPSFKNAVESEIVLRDFDAPVNMVENYIQRLTSYLQVERLYQGINPHQSLAPRLRRGKAKGYWTVL